MVYIIMHATMILSSVSSSQTEQDHEQWQSVTAALQMLAQHLFLTTLAFWHSVGTTTPSDFDVFTNVVQLG